MKKASTPKPVADALTEMIGRLQPKPSRKPINKRGKAIRFAEAPDQLDLVGMKFPQVQYPSGYLMAVDPDGVVTGTYSKSFYCIREVTPKAKGAK